MLAVLPARLGSERLPRKPLQPLLGKPLIQWVWERAASFSGIDHIVIATDAEEIAAVARGFNANVELTAEYHRSGTERAAEVAARVAYADYDVVLNIQGDEPFITEEQVHGAVQQVREGFDIGTVAAPIADVDALNDPAVVKVVRGDDGRALYFSRAPVPHSRDGVPATNDLNSTSYLRHIGVYAYSRAALARWIALPETELERIEKLEQLRPLAAGLTIGVGIVAAAHGGIDTPADVIRAEAILSTESSS